MAKDDMFDGPVKDKISKVDGPPPITMEQLMKMLIDSQTELAKAQTELGKSILEARKPYVDPKVLEAKARDLEEKRKLIAIQQKEREVRKKVCPHMRENGTYNIKWHQHSNGIVLGVCGTCFSQFDARNQDDLRLLRLDLKSMKNMARAGEHARRGNVIEG